jgi:UDP-N-acetylmuramyl pentapeptide phosphotransferase/UDP-N-acetylglucosamine-1-phosphate transferase
VIFFLGLKDDILILSAKKKFLGQLAAAAILIHLGNVRIESMHGFLGIGHLPAIASYLLSYITLIVVVNAFNLIDGVDGLAGSLGVLTTLTFGIYFYLANQPMYAMLGFAMAGSLLAFLIFNFAPAKIFMGDSGSLLLGLVNAVLVIKFITISDSATVPVQLDSSVAIGFAILIVPLLDTLRVFSIRILKGRSPFSADRNHIHHLLLATNMSHRGVAVTCLALNVSFILIAFLGRSLGSTWLITLMIACFFGLMATLRYMTKSKAVLQGKIFQQNAGDSLVIPASKVVTFKTESAMSEPS